MMNFSTISTFAMMTRDMPSMALMALEKGKIRREENDRKISYTHQAEGSPYRHIVDYDKQTGEYSAYSHHIPSGRTKRKPHPKEHFEHYKARYHEQSL